MSLCLFPLFDVFSTNMLLFSVMIEPEEAGAERDEHGMPRYRTFSTGVCRVCLVVETVITQCMFSVRL